MTQDMELSVSKALLVGTMKAIAERLEQKGIMTKVAFTKMIEEYDVNNLLDDAMDYGSQWLELIEKEKEDQNG